MIATIPKIDLVILSRDSRPLNPLVQRGVGNQTGVELVVHRLQGTPSGPGEHRWATIARARNRGKQLGNSSWLMFLDDDVVLDSNCVASLYRELRLKTSFGALASNYLNEKLCVRSSPRHVGMGATLFRRKALDNVTFRWTDADCECQCCCNDLRQKLIGISYLPEARSYHLRRPDNLRHSVAQSVSNCKANRQRISAGSCSGRILTAFDRAHFEAFRYQFLESLRGCGNAEIVTVVGYGLHPQQEQFLAKQSDLTYLARPLDDRVPARRRLHDFQDAIRELAGGTCVAYWDAGDTIFQSSLGDLWKQVERCPGKLLCCPNAANHPQDTAVSNWTKTIRDPTARHRVFDLLSQNVWINGGFAAGTVRTLSVYLRQTAAIRESSTLAGTLNRGDQTAMNYFLHTHPEFWQELDSTWNYCLCRRPLNDYKVLNNGLFVQQNGQAINVVHGNAHTLPKVSGIERVRRRIRKLAWARACR